jgi:hypothetical protein
VRIKWQLILATAVFLIGVGGLLFYDLYFQPYVLSTGVVKVKVQSDFMPKNHKLTNDDLYIDKVSSQDIPKNALLSFDQAVNKIINVNLTDGTMLTNSLVDVDDLQPGNGEGIFPIPKTSIYAINGTLRSRDKVDIYLVQDKDTKTGVTGQNNSVLLPAEQAKFLEKIAVSSVRTEDNNDVKDTDSGNTNNRATSTGKVSTPELKLTDEQGSNLKDFLQAGYKVWIVRVE